MQMTYTSAAVCSRSGTPPDTRDTPLLNLSWYWCGNKPFRVAAILTKQDCAPLLSQPTGHAGKGKRMSCFAVFLLINILTHYNQASPQQYPKFSGQDVLFSSYNQFYSCFPNLWFFFFHLHQNTRSLKTRGMSVITPMQYKHVTSLWYYLLFHLC